MASTEEFKIKTEVEVDIKKAEVKLKNFTDNKNNPRKIPVEIELKNTSKALDKEIRKLGNKIDEKLKINGSNISSFKKVENSLRNMKSTLKDIEGMLNRGKFRVNSNFINSKQLGKNLQILENCIKKAEKKFNDLDKAQKKIGNTKSGKVPEVDVNINKATDKLEKFNNRLEQLRHRFKNLDINLVGIDNIEKAEKKLDELYSKAKANSQQGKAIRSPEVDLDLKNLMEMLKILRKIQTQYNNFQNLKVNLGDSVDISSLNEIERAFKDIARRAADMDNLDIDFNVDGVLHALKRVNGELKQSKDHFSSVKRIASDFKSEIASYTIGEALGDVTVDFARDLGQAYLELDRSMREIKKVADPGDIDTVQKLNNIRKEAISVAKDVGMSSSDVQRSIGAALQAGIGGMKESIAVAKQSMILANVGDMTQEAASKAINTVVKSFRLNPLKEFQIEVGNTKKKTTELKNAMDLLNFAG